MASTDPTNRGPERPRSEPEIIAPGQDSPRSEVSGIWISVDERDGVRRVYVKRSGMFTVILGLLAIVAVALAAFLVVLSFALIWLPIALFIVAAFLLSGTVRYYWYRFLGWLHGR